jgi:hypothetical protein
VENIPVLTLNMVIDGKCTKQEGYVENAAAGFPFFKLNNVIDGK